MNTSDLNTNVLTHTAIAALKNAYDECSDKTAKESIFIASKAIMQLHLDLGKINSRDNDSENDSVFDASEYCAAV